MGNLQRLKLQSKENPTKYKYITSSNYEVGDTVCFKWHKQWTVIKILELTGRYEK